MTDNKQVIHNGTTKHKDHIAEKLNKNPPDNFYYNATIFSDFTQRFTSPVYNVTRTRTDIVKASDYYLSVIRFNIPAYYAPLAAFICQEGEINKGIYALKLIYGDDSTDYVHLTLDPITPENKYYQSTPNTTPDGNIIYYLFNYDQMTDALNRAFIEAYNNLNGVSLEELPQNGYPYVVYNASTLLYTLFVPGWYRTDVGAYNLPFKIVFNEYLYELFHSFPMNPFDLTSVNPEIESGGYVINFPPTLPIQNLAYRAAYGDIPEEWENGLTQSVLRFRQYIAITQEYSTIYSWNPFGRILLTSTLLPIRTEYVKGAGNNVYKILIDYIPQSDLSTLRASFQYSPTTQYRLVDLMSDKPLRHFDLNVWWQDKYLNLNKLLLLPNATMSVKIGFFSKELANHNHLKGYVVL